MVSQKKIWQKIIGFIVFPEASEAEDIKGSTVGRLFMRNLIFFVTCTTLTIVSDIIISHNFNAWLLLANIIIDVILAILFAYGESQWIIYRQKDKKHFSQYHKKDNNQLSL